MTVTRRVVAGSSLCLLAGCRAEDRAPAADSAGEQMAPVTAASARSADRAGAPPSDHAVYTAVLREVFLRPRQGEHSLHCEDEKPGGRLVIVGTTQPLPPGTPARDSGWANELPAPAAPLLAALRALDREPAGAIAADSLAVGVPVDVVSDSMAVRILRPIGKSSTPDGAGEPPLRWVSRVVYSVDGVWALVYAVQLCPGTTEAKMADAENGAYETVILAPLERRDGVWTVHSPVFLDVGLPRLQPR